MKTQIKSKYNSVTSIILNTWLKRYLNIKEFCSFDVETTGLDFRKSKIFSYCIGHYNGEIEVWRLDGDKKQSQKGWARLREFFNDPNIAKIVHNHKFELNFLKKHNINIARGTIFHDTMLMSRMVRNLAPSHSLDYLCWELGDYTIDTPYGELNSLEIDMKVKAQAEARGKRYDKVDKSLMKYYQIADAERPLLLFHIFEPLFKKNLKMYRDYISEVLTMQVTEEMEKVGVCLHWGKANNLHEWLEKELEKVRDETFSLLGEYINLNSEPQLIQLLYKKYGYPVLKKTDKGHPATDKFVILELRKTYNNPIFNLILRNRSYTSAKSMLESYFNKANSEGVIYPTINSCQAKTHRQSGENPNMQNIGKGLYDEEQSPFPVNMRTVFRAPIKYFLCLGDYASIEMRLIIEVSQCMQMIQLMKDGGNPHIEACKIFYPKIFKSKKENNALYNWGKNGHFAIGYGAGPKKLKTTLKLDSLKETINVFNNYREVYPEIANCSKTISRIVKKQGYVETKFGNKLYVAKNRAYAGLNALIQCTAAKILKRGEINVHNYLQNQWSGDVKLMMVIHDEAILKFPRSLISKKDEILYDCSKLLCDMPEIDVPLEVEWKKTLLTWDKAKDIYIPDMSKNYLRRMEWVKTI